MPSYLVNKTESIHERNYFRTMSLEKLFRILKTFEMELEQRLQKTLWFGIIGGQAYEHF